MYKGNMYEFLDKVVEYVQRKYGVELRVTQEPKIEWVNGGIIQSKTETTPVMWDRYNHGGVGVTLYDRENFEDDVFKFVNERLKKRGLI
jgi:hypothetical protein